MPETILISPAAGKPGLFDAFWRGEFIGRSRCPLLETCRMLLDKGVDPNASVTLRHTGADHDALTSTVGYAASLTVSDTGTPRFCKWRPFAGMS